MRRVFFPLLGLLVACCALVGAGGSTALVYHRMQATEAEQAIEQAATLPTMANLIDAIGQASAVAGSFGATADDALRLYPLYRSLLQHDASLEDRVALYCASLSALGQALRSVPDQGSWLIQWADLRQLLQGVQCPNPATSGDPAAVVRYALSHAPNDPDVLFQGSFLLRERGDRSEANGLLRRFLTLSVVLPAARSERILDSLHSAGDIVEVVPAAFPHAAIWSELVATRQPQRFRALQPTFESLQESAIAQSSAGFQRGTIPKELHTERLVRLAPWAASDKIRAALDRDLAKLLSYGESGAEAEAAAYLAARSRLSKLETVIGSVPLDTRPFKSSLAYWTEPAPRTKVRSPTSVGFVLQNDERLQRLELSLSALGVRRLPQLALLVSDDNREWSAYPGALEWQVHNLPTGAVAVAEIASSRHRYWKVVLTPGSGEQLERLLPLETLRLWGERIN